MESLPRTSTGKGPADRFTGDVLVDMIQAAAPPGRMGVAEVGQALRCTRGEGVVVTRDGTVIRLMPGMTVWTPPEEEHWHGAAADSLMSHLARQEVGEQPDPTRWLEPVDDAQYARATAAAKEQA